MKLSTSKRISLWLLPPEPLITTLTNQQAEIIANHPKDRLLPRFVPHITLIGGVPISECCSIEEITQQNRQSDIDEQAAQIVLQRLQLAFQSHGRITCSFVKARGVFAVRVDDHGTGEGTVQWNQSCISLVERNSSFMRAMEVAEEALFASSTTYNKEQSSIERHFKAPLFEPHYSFVYGNDPHLIPSSLECPPLFTSTEMVVIWTYPSNLGGVENWREIGRVKLMEE